MSLSIIAAVAKNNVIGKNNDIPWHLPADFSYFKKTTDGKTVIMGQNTFESILSIGGKPLPNRKNIILTRDENYKAEGCTIINSWEKILKLGKGDEEMFIIGGAQVYALAMPYANKIYVTEVDAEPEGDTFFPEIKKDEWNEIFSEFHEKDEKNNYNYTFKIYEHK
ncbi:MAG: type 3 dihydrofolate reductase [Patescibacteria group bacterium]